MIFFALLFLISSSCYCYLGYSIFYITTTARNNKCTRAGRSNHRLHLRGADQGQARQKGQALPGGLLYCARFATRPAREDDQHSEPVVRRI